MRKPSTIPSSLPPYCFEHGGGGGGGRKSSHLGDTSGRGGRDRTKNTDIEGPLPRFIHEDGGGGGGGPAEAASPVIDYTISHRIDQPSRRVQVVIVVDELQGVAPPWQHATTLSSADIKQLQAADENSNRIDVRVEPGTSSSVIFVDFSDKPTKRPKCFSISYSVGFDSFFEYTRRQTNKRTSFDYQDIYWISYNARTFLIEFDFPTVVEFDKLTPMPFAMQAGNKLFWTLTKYAANVRHKVRLTGSFGAK